MKTTTTLLLGAVVSVLASCGGSSGGGGGGGGSGSTVSNLQYPVPSAVHVVGVPIHENQPTVQDTVTGCSTSPQLPAGLVFDSSNGTIRGTPTQPTQTRNYTVTATGSGGDVSTPVRIGVERPERFLLVRDGADGSVSAFTADAATGTLAHHSYASVATGGTTLRDLAVDGPHAWALVGDPGTIVQLSIDPATGQIVLGAEVPAGDGPRRLLVRLDGRFAYVLDVSGKQLLGYSIDVQTGELTEQPSNAQSTAAGAVDAALDPRGGRYLYLSTSSNSKIASYPIGSTNGQLQPPAAELVLPGPPGMLAVSPDGEHLCVLLPGTGDVAYVDIDRATGALTLLNVRRTGPQPNSIAFHPSGRAVFALNQGANNLSVLPIDAERNELGGSLPKVGTSTQPQSLAFDPAGSRLFVAAKSANAVDVFDVDPVTLVPVLDTTLTGRGFPTGFHVVQGDTPIEKESRFLYTLNGDGDSVSAFAIEDDGTLTPLGADALAGEKPSAIAIDPFGRFVFAASRLTHEVFVFPIDDTGALGNPIVRDLANGFQEPVALAVDRSGSHLYVATDKQAGNPTPNAVLCYEIDGTTGELTAVDVAPWPNGDPVSMTTDPAGRFLLVSTKDKLRIHAPIDGELGAATESAEPPSPIDSFAFDPTGKRVWVSLPAASEIRCYDVAPLTGTWSLASTTSAAREPFGLVALHGTPFLYVALADGDPTDTVAVVTAAEQNGELSVVEEEVVGSSPRGLALDATGSFLYSVTSGADFVSIFEVDRATGTLTPVTTTQSGAGPLGLALETQIH